MQPNSGYLTNNGVLGATGGGLLWVDASIGGGAGTGGITIGQHGLVVLQASVDASQTVTFLDATGSLDIEVPSSFAATISGFQAGDALNLSSIGDAVSATWDAGVLTLLDGGSNILWPGAVSGDYAGDTFAVSSFAGSTPYNGYTWQSQVTLIPAASGTDTWQGPAGDDWTTPTVSATNFQVTWGTGEVMNVTLGGTYINTSLTLARSDMPGSIQGL